MKNPHETPQNRHSEVVQQALEGVTKKCMGRYTYLEQLREGTLSLREFAFSIKVRLEAASSFIPFLTKTEQRMRSEGQWQDMADVLKSNLHDELGIVEEKEDISKAHLTWRNNFRSGIQRVLDLKGISWEEINAKKSIQYVDSFYGGALKEFAEEDTIPALAGGFAVLEGILEQEFLSIHNYIRSNLSEMLPRERLYIEHHAGHEHKHYKECQDSLLRKCIY